jgi:hypothetical protein
MDAKPLRRDVMKIALLLLVSACAVPKRTVAGSHPASAKAPAGRLAGAPPSLRPGVVEYKDVPAVREGEPKDGGGHHQHH